MHKASDGGQKTSQARKEGALQHHARNKKGGKEEREQRELRSRRFALVLGVKVANGLHEKKKTCKERL